MNFIQHNSVVKFGFCLEKKSKIFKFSAQKMRHGHEIIMPQVHEHNIRGRKRVCNNEAAQPPTFFVRLYDTIYNAFLSINP